MLEWIGYGRRIGGGNVDHEPVWMDEWLGEQMDVYWRRVYRKRKY